MNELKYNQTHLLHSCFKFSDFTLLLNSIMPVSKHFYLMSAYNVYWKLVNPLTIICYEVQVAHYMKDHAVAAFI